MSNSRTPPDANPAQRLELTASQDHNGADARDGDKPHRRIVAIVKLLARLAAEKDFREDPDER
jgi:hypothetical protein